MSSSTPRLKEKVQKHFKLPGLSPRGSPRVQQPMGGADAGGSAWDGVTKVASNVAIEKRQSLKQQKGKLKGMSKAEKRDVKARKKKLAHEIHERVARSNDKARAAVAPAEAQAADEEFRFELAALAVQLDDAWAPR